MNFLKSILILLLVIIAAIGCKEKSTENLTTNQTETKTPKVKKEIASANLQTASFTIKGMTCAIGCAKTIEEELNSLEGVKIAKVDFEKESATVSYDKTLLTPEKLTTVVEATADGKSYKVFDIK